MDYVLPNDLIKMMPDKIQKYVEKRADLAARPLVAGVRDGVKQAVVIPALAEKESLFQTLNSLAKNEPEELARTLVICVVNNRTPSVAASDEIENNRQTIDILDTMVRGRQVLVGGESFPAYSYENRGQSRRGMIPRQPSASSRLRVGYIDASSPGHELPEKGGVGMARKIGLDWALAILDPAASPGLLLSLDADTLVDPNYLSAVREHFVAQNAWAAAIAYAHRLDGPLEETAAIVCYEIFLRYHVLGLRYAGSPYAFHSIGSTIACRADAYVAVSGMNQRQAGEDFYFLEQLAKTGGVDEIGTTTVYPSARPSSRVPFGTGRRVRRFLAHTHDEYLLYDPRSYQIIKDWLAIVADHLDGNAADLLTRAGTICPQLRVFLESNNFAQAWERLQRNSAGHQQLHSQFHRWFDGFRTMKLIHHLRDNGFPERPMFESL